MAWRGVDVHIGDIEKGREGGGRKRLLSAWMANCIHNHGAEERKEGGKRHYVTRLVRSYSTNVRRETVSVEFLLF